MRHRVTQGMCISMNRLVIPILLYLKETLDLIYPMQNMEKFLQSEVISSDLSSIARKMCEFQASLKAFHQMAKPVKSCFCQPLSMGVRKSKNLNLSEW